MRKDRAKAKQLKELRSRAEKLLRKNPKTIQDVPGDDIQKLIHELQVHQIELEMQNDELRKAQLELEESRNRYYHLYDFAPIGYFTFDKNGLIIEVNLTGTDLLGVEKAHLMKRKFFDFIAPDFQDVFYFHRKKVFEFTTRQTCELKLVRKDGTSFYAQLESVAVQDGEGNFNQFRTAITDITDRKRAEEKLKEYSERLEEMVDQRTKELRRAQEELIRKEKVAILGQLAAGMGHELRNPLGAIKNASYFLNMTLEEPEPKVKETLGILEKEVNTSERIISSLLGFARPKPPSRRKVNINETVEEALSRATVPENVEVVNRLDGGLPAIMADPDQLGQTFGNIILNAIQAMPEGGQLMVKSEAPTSQWVAISFADTGVGIPEENLGGLFEPLFTTKAKGIGLGLSLSKALAKVHGGTIEVQSKVGNGSTFTVMLPVR